MKKPKAMSKPKAKSTCKRQQSATPTSQSILDTRTCAVAACSAMTSRGQLCAEHYAMDLNPPWRIVGSDGKIKDKKWEECVPTDVSDLQIGKSLKLDTFIRKQCEWLAKHPARSGVVAAGQLAVQRSQNKMAGFGLFTTGPMYAGEVIAEYTGTKQSKTEYNKTYPGDDTTRDYALTCALSVVDASVTTATIARFVNTSRQVKANDGNSYRTKARNNCTFYELDGRLFLLTDQRSLEVAATSRRTRLYRAIPADAELYVSYGTRYWGKLVAPDVKTLDLKYWIKVPHRPKKICIEHNCTRKAHTRKRCETCNKALQAQSVSKSGKRPLPHTPPKPAPKRKSARRRSSRRQSARRQSSRRRGP